MGNERQGEDTENSGRTVITLVSHQAKVNTEGRDPVFEDRPSRPNTKHMDTVGT